MPGKIINPNFDIWYMDSSGISRNCDVSVYGLRVEQREFITMGSLSTVFQVEVIAILMCTELFLSKNVMKENIYLL
jgi:hypothetical protein